MRKALYREYRPTRLEDVVGQESVTSALAGAVKKGQFSHAYLFIGPRGCGKTSVARIFAHAVNKFPYKLEDSYVDIIEIDAASNTGVDNIRELREKAIISPTEGKYKVYIIDEVHMLSKSAFNALLKILEEPPAHVIFIMATTDPQKVPVTITSRAQTYTFKLATPAVMKAHLEKIAEQEKLDIEDAALDLIVRRGGGSFRDSISLLDQISTLAPAAKSGKSDTGAKITAALVESALGLPADQQIQQLLDAYLTADDVKITTLLQDIINSGTKPEALASDLISRIIEAPQRALLPLLSALPTVTGSFPEAKLLLAFLNTSHPNGTPAGVSKSTNGSVAFTSSVKQSENASAGVREDVDGVSLSARQPKNVSGGADGSVAYTSPPASPPTYIPDGTDGFARRAVPPAGQRMTSTGESGVLATDAPATTATPFDWQAFLKTISRQSSGIHNVLTKCTHELKDGTLTIYTPNTTYQKILDASHNRTLLKNATNLEILVTERHAAPSPFSQISDIMGAVEEVDSSDGTPF